MRSRVASCIGLALLVCSMACHGGGDTGDSRLVIAMTSSTPPGGLTDVVWLAEGGSSSRMLQVDVLSRDLLEEFDGLNLELLFDPSVAEVVAVSGAGLLPACTGVGAVTAENVSNGNANTTGVILYSEQLPGGTPPGCTTSGDMVVARVVFRARGRGMTGLDFAPAAGDPNNPTGSRLFRRDPPVPRTGAQFFDGGAQLEVTR